MVTFRDKLIFENYWLRVREYHEVLPVKLKNYLVSTHPSDAASAYVHVGVNTQFFTQALIKIGQVP